MIILISIAAVGVQLDRESRKNHPVARLVPSFFQSYALEPLAREAYAAGLNEEGLKYSRELLMRRPIPAENLGLLTNGLVSTDQSEMALAALILSAQRGWRDRYTQRLMVASALEVGDSKVAAQRLLALWRLGDREPQTFFLTANLFSDVNGLKQFISGLAPTDKTWSTDILVWAGENLSGRAVALLFHSFKRKNVAISNKKISESVIHFLRIGRTKEALSLWDNTRAVDQEQRKYKGNLLTYSDGAGPFEWTFPGEAGVDADFVKYGGATILSYNNAKQIYLLISKRLLVLSPGKHSIKAAFGEEAGGDRSNSTGIDLKISCIDGKLNRKLARIHMDSSIYQFIIPSSACTVQEISILAPPGRGVLTRLDVDL